MVDNQRQAVKSATRVLDLFELLAGWGDAMSHTRIAAALKIPKSSLSQLLPNLVDRGYIEYVADLRAYRLGPQLGALARDISQSQTLDAIALPILQELTAKCSESSALNVLRGDDTEVTIAVNSPQRLVSHMRVGDRAPLYATSGGKAMLAFLPDALTEDYLERVVFEPITPNTVTSAQQLREQIETARKDGVAHVYEEFTPGIVGLAVAVLSASGRPLGAINVAMPAVRYNPGVHTLVVEALKFAAGKITQRLEKERPGGNRG